MYFACGLEELYLSPAQVLNSRFYNIFIAGFCLLVLCMWEWWFLMGCIQLTHFVHRLNLQVQQSFPFLSSPCTSQNCSGPPPPNYPEQIWERCKSKSGKGSSTAHTEVVTCMQWFNWVKPLQFNLNCIHLFKLQLTWNVCLTVIISNFKYYVTI